MQNHFEALDVFSEIEERVASLREAGAGLRVHRDAGLAVDLY